MKKVIQCIILSSLLIYSGGICWAISISATGSWSETIDSSDLQAGAGSDLIDTYESATNAVSINISDTAGSWEVYVEKLDTNWRSDLHLYIQRTSDGEGSGSIADGGTYQEVTGSQLFFSGIGDRSAITVQLELMGVSIQVPPDTYKTTVCYTVSGP